MVVFTCNNCGDSLHKPKVEKHYAFACRTNKSLTCVDCFKDFRGEEYVSHTKCLTEDERYAAKGTFVNGNVKKGEVKQESWVEMIKSILDNGSHLNPSCRNLLNIISGYSNIPRKKPKFVNFIKSSFGGRVNQKDIEEVWNIIEKYKNDQSKLNVQANIKTGNGKLEENSMNGDSAVKDSKNEENETKKRKSSGEEINENIPKKKKKLKTVSNDEIPVQPSDETVGENKVFSFQDKILEVLSKKGSISSKKLQKKVLNAYLKETGEPEVTPKIIKKFTKKLKKISNLEITDDRVTLLEVPN